MNKQYGLKAYLFAITATITIIITIATCYYLALKQGHVPPFPETDITHTGIHYPEYIFMRIGFIAVAPFLIVTWFFLRFFIDYTSMQLIGGAQKQSSKIFHLGILGAMLLGIGTAAISDGKNDMNWTLHVGCATGFFVVTLYQITIISKIYKKFWDVDQNFVCVGSYIIKRSVYLIVLTILLLQLLTSSYLKHMDGLPQLFGTGYLIIFFISICVDLKDVEVYLHNPIIEQNNQIILP